MPALSLIVVVIVVAKFGSSPNAAANSFNVSSVVGAVLTRFVIKPSAYVTALEYALDASVWALAALVFASIALSYAVFTELADAASVIDVFVTESKTVGIVGGFDKLL